MHIDWFVLLAQIINFLVLVWLLKFFLYGRIIKAMDERQARLAAARDEAEKFKVEAEASAKQYEEMRRALESHATSMLDEAHKKADAEKTELVEVARREVDGLRSAWKNTLSNEKAAFLNELKSRAGAHIQETLRRILADLADTSLEERIVLSFLEHIQTADGGALELLRQADSGTEVLVRTSFEINWDIEARLVRHLKTMVSEGVPLIHETVPGEIAGIEILSNGKKISWSIGEYLDDLKQRFNEALGEEIPDAPEVLST